MTETPFPFAEGIHIDLSDTPSPFAGMDVAARLASLADASYTISGVFESPLESPLVTALSPEPARRDLTFTPAEDEVLLCPECHEPASEVRCEGARVDAGTDKRDGKLIVSIQATDMVACEYRPCGHRFDGATGELISAPEGLAGR